MTFKTAAEMWIKKDSLVARIRKAKESLNPRAYKRIYDKLESKSELGNIEKNTNSTLEGALKEMLDAWENQKRKQNDLQIK